MSKIVDYHKRFTNKTNRWVSFDSTQSLWVSHLSTKAILGKGLGFIMHVLIQRPSIIGEDMLISSIVAFLLEELFCLQVSSRSIDQPPLCNDTYDEYGVRWAQICRANYGRNMSWRSSVGFWAQLDLPEGSSRRHRSLQELWVPERVYSDAGPRGRVRVWFQPWKPFGLEGSPPEFQGANGSSGTNSCTYQCRSSVWHDVPGWPSEKSHSNSTKAILRLWG